MTAQEFFKNDLFAENAGVVPLARRKVIVDEREKASVPCELAAAASARSASVKIAPPCVRAPALRCSGFISNLALL